MNPSKAGLEHLKRGLRLGLAIAMVAIIPLLATCSGDGPVRPPVDDNSLEGQIRVLFPAGAALQDAALSQIAGVRQQVTASNTAQARSRALALVDFTLTSLRDGRLVGGTSASTRTAASRLVDGVYQLVGLDPPRLPDGSLTNDGTAQVVGPEGGLVVSPSGVAGVQIPPGALGQQVLVVVTRLPATPTPGTGPLPTSLKQYPPFYEFSTYPNVPQFGDSMRVGICQVTDPASPLYPPGSHDRLRLAHGVGTSVEILERVGVSDFLRCTNVSADRSASGVKSRGWGAALRSLVADAIGLLSPVPVYAAHGGLGGKIKSFSPFGAVDPTSGGVSGSEFSIATTAAEESFGGAAFDGTNYLVGLQSRIPQNRSTVQAQLVSQSGALVGSSIVVPNVAGDPPRIAFDGTNYLMAWADHTNGDTSVPILGQFVSKAGVLLGGQFTIVPGTTPSFVAATALLYGGGTYFVVYEKIVPFNNEPNRFKTFGRLVSPTGIVGPDLALSSGLTSPGGFNNAAFDGTNFLTVYTDGSSAKARFVSSGGGVGQEVTIVPAVTQGLEPTVTVGFNGTSYLATVGRKGTVGSDAMAQLVSRAGASIGGLIPIATDAAIDEIAVGVLASGSNFVVSYLDSKGLVSVRFVSGTGVLVGGPLTIASPSGGKVPVGGVFHFNGSKYFAVFQRGVPSASSPSDIEAFALKDVYGALLTIPTPTPNP